MSTMPQSCILCEIGSLEGHPSHPEAPRGHGHDYRGLWEAQRQRKIEWDRQHRRLRNPFDYPFAGQCVKCRNGKAKTKYGSETTARKKAKRIGNPMVKPYFCGECHNWHIGSQDRTVGA